MYSKYPKIETLFDRDEHFNVVPAKIRKPVFATINKWQVTEKIDGTNIRITLNLEGEVKIGGRTDAAQIPADLIDVLLKMFPVEKMKEVLWGDRGPQEVTLFGEGYGAGIQKIGKMYRADKSFRLFDILIDGKWWLDWENVSGIAQALGIKTAPYFGEMSLDQIIDLVRAGFASHVATEDSNQELEAEGVVAKPIEPLFDRRGERVILKLKTVDFNHPNKEGGDIDV